MEGRLQRSSLSELLEADQQLPDRLALHTAPCAANQLSQHTCTTHTIKQASTVRPVSSLLQVGLHGLMHRLDIGRIASQLFTELLDNCNTNCTLRHALLGQPKHLPHTGSHDRNPLCTRSALSTAVHTCTSSAPSTADCATGGITSGRRAAEGSC